MYKAKYKVGEKVRIIDRNKKSERLMVPGQEKWCGKVMTILKMDGWKYRMAEDQGENWGFGWGWDDSMISGPATPYPVIVITTDGTTTTAVMRQGKHVLRVATAVCAPDDEFVYAVGAKLATKRVLSAPMQYNGKVVCVGTEHGCGGMFTVGKVYEIVNSILQDDNGDIRALAAPEDSLELLGAKLVPLKA